jgi:hypothetical protein
MAMDGKQRVVSGGGGAGTEMIEPASAAFGRGKEEAILYVTTASGQVVAIDTTQFH